MLVLLLLIAEDFGLATTAAGSGRSWTLEISGEWSVASDAAMVSWYVPWWIEVVRDGKIARFLRFECILWCFCHIHRSICINYFEENMRNMQCVWNGVFVRTEVEVPDYSQLGDDGLPLYMTVELNPKKDFKDNAKLCFKQAHLLPAVTGGTIQSNRNLRLAMARGNQG